MQDGRERAQLIEWDARRRNFRYSDVQKGTEISVSQAQPSRTLWRRQRPMIDFHTHPESATFFSRHDIRVFLSRKQQAHMNIVGTSFGGFALCATAELKNMNWKEAEEAAAQVEVGRPEFAARTLRDYGLVTYEWRAHEAKMAKGCGIMLKRL